MVEVIAPQYALNVASAPVSNAKYLSVGLERYALQIRHATPCCRDLVITSCGAAFKPCPTVALAVPVQLTIENPALGLALTVDAMLGTLVTDTPESISCLPSTMSPASAVQSLETLRVIAVIDAPKVV